MEWPLPLPTVVKAPDARRLVAALQKVEQGLNRSETIIIFGSAAVSLYLADENHTDPAYTDDIDVDQSSSPIKAFETFMASDGLHFQAALRPGSATLVKP